MGKFSLLYVALACLTACNFSVSTSEGIDLDIAGFEKKTPDNVAEFSNKVMQSLYNKDKEFILKHAGPELKADFTDEFFIFLFQMQQPTARPDLAKNVSSQFREEKNLRDFLTFYHVPTEIGRDYVYVGLRGDEKDCCTISTINFNVKFGKEHKMKEYRPKNTDSSE